MRKSEEVRRQLARALIRIGAVVFSPEEMFTWASGIESPVYVDNRLTISHPEVRRQIVEGFVTIMDAESISADVVVGTATAGIPHAAWLAERLDLPMAYVRGSAKAHGRRNKLEGNVEAGSRGIVIEDLVSTGGSSLDAVETLKSVDIDVRAVMAVFSYGLDVAAEAFAESGVPLFVLTDFDALLEAAVSTGRLEGAEVEAVRRWHARLTSGQAASRSR